MSKTLEEAIANAEAQAIRDEKEAERKRKYGGKFYDAKCSNCGKTFSDAYDMENYDGYCRFCGCKMVGFKGETK